MVLEKIYGKVFYYFLYSINPIKKQIIDTPCSIHKFINLQSLEILKNDNYLDAFNFFTDNLVSLNDGVVWADQDFKSSGHFYNPYKERGLYGNRDALSLAKEYYNNTIECWKKNNLQDSVFYLGATVHIIQDMTIPQHANIRLLDSHRQYENFVRRNYQSYKDFVAEDGGYYFDNIDEFVKYNSRNAINIYNKLKEIENENERFYKLTRYILPLAQRTSAGCLMRFYKDTMKENM
ncbi:zinc dependent phospholipase C family protein [Pseudobacteroides cellulosolvens]|uniref:Phospholipase C n=1 Tax=Pseudobacteroides cellulosolvens ATCC 35603 = DSM 2933 TaxID=398512 RepID=A0A0L6JK68_9FIRM|nr:zinc dependent phospholipase C family protein [Pseudobacteroides cellulosolvens]KNY25752.1 phospholipase C/P1 nuclease [Pseudobacteroides cellulosolvens ATCC 35603 = DSM 2933]